MKSATRALNILHRLAEPREPRTGIYAEALEPGGGLEGAEPPQLFDWGVRSVYEHPPARGTQTYKHF